MLTLKKRPQPSQFWAYGAPVVAVLLTMIFGAALFAALGKPPIEALGKIFYEPLFGQFNFFYLPQLLIKGAPLVLIAIGLSLGFRAGIWNIGAEGQYIIGALTAAAVGLAFYPMEARWLIFPLMILGGALGGFASVGAGRGAIDREGEGVPSGVPSVQESSQSDASGRRCGRFCDFGAALGRSSEERNEEGNALAHC